MYGFEIHSHMDVDVCMCVWRQLLWLVQLAGYKLQAMSCLSCGESFSAVAAFCFFLNFIGKSIRLVSNCVWLLVGQGLNLFDFIEFASGK